MLTIKPLMNSCVEDVLAFKTCCGLQMNDQNLELHVTNEASAPLRVQSRLLLVLDDGEEREISNLTPQGDPEMAAGETIALYCMMDEQLWKSVKKIAMFDTGGARYESEVDGADCDGK